MWRWIEKWNKNYKLMSELPLISAPTGSAHISCLQWSLFWKVKSLTDRLEKWLHTYLQQQDEVVHRVVSCVQIVTRAQPVVWVKVHFLVDTGVTEQVEQNLLGHASGAEVLHFYRGQRSQTQDTVNSLSGRWCHAADQICLDCWPHTPRSSLISVFVALQLQTWIHKPELLRWIIIYNSDIIITCVVWNCD